MPWLSFFAAVGILALAASFRISSLVVLPTGNKAKLSCSAVNAQRNYD